MNLEDLDKLISSQVYFRRTSYGNYNSETTWDWWKSESRSWNKDTEAYENRRVEIPDVGIVEYEDSYGGEDEGTSYWVVVKLTEPSGNVRYFEKLGYYSSYSYADSYFEESEIMNEVTPEEETVIRWKDIKNND